MEESRGIILFNRGEKCIVRAIVCLYSLRQHYDGDVTFFLERPYPQEFDEVCKYFNCKIVHNEENHNLSVLVRKTDMFGNPPYDRTLWIDSDTVIVGKLDDMFNYLDDCDVCIPNFSDWISSGSHISKRINRFKGIIEDRYIEEALRDHAAINTGVLSFKKTDKWKKFVEDWVKIADIGSKKHIFISDEVSFQVLYPSISDWGLKCFIAPSKFNVSVVYGEKIEDKRCLHAHGQKHCLDFNLCYMWKEVFEHMRKENIANINSFLQYADKRLVSYLQGGQDVTIVTACDEKYVEILRETFPNWRKYKSIDDYPVIVFVHGIELLDSRLDFLRLKNVKIVPWKMENAESHREEMLSAFVFGAAEHVKTDYWLKLDADSYATDSRPFIDNEMKQYAFCGHKWSYSRPEHINKLDKWAKGHWKRKLRNAEPMIKEGEIEGNRFYHNTRRTISFIQLHKTRFTQFCIKLLRERKLPAPTQDTFMFYVANRFDPKSVGTRNFKKDYGFTQGNGRRGFESIKEAIRLVDEKGVAYADSNEE